MSRTIIAVLALALVAVAANPLQPVRRGREAVPFKPDQFRVAFWDTPKFDPALDAPPLPAELVISGYPGDGDGYYLVQFDGPATAGQAAALEEAGARFLGFHSRFLGFLHGDRDAANRVAQLGFVRWVGPYQPGYKFWSGTLDATGYGRVAVILFRDADLDRAIAELGSLGCEPVRSAASDDFKVVEVDCRQELVAAIARLPYVLSVEEWHEPQLENENCQWVLQDWAQNQRRVWDQGIFGSDEILGYTDTGLDVNHYAFRDPGQAISDTGEFPTHRKVVVFKHYPPAGGVGDPNGHGTHVAGTIAGNDSVNGGASAHDGHSKNARIVHLSPIPDPPGKDFTVPLNMISNDLRNPELRPHTMSHSWWTGTRGQYTAAAASFDNFCWFNRDIVQIKSCGNQGQSSRYLITEPGNSKSIISAASVQNGTGSTVLSSFSSRGPAPDDRIKPDISVPGENIYSASRNTQNSYTSMSGTSMAAPATNGSIGLLRSYLRKGYYPSGQANAVDTFGYVSAALLKAMLLVSADPNVGSYVVPSEYIGWGRANLDSVMFFNDSVPDARKLLLDDDTTGLETGEYVEYVFQVSDTMPLRAGVVWTDTAAAAGANPALINDLDVLLTGPGGDFYKGNLYSSGHSEPNPAGAFDALNPLEMFRVHAPQAGTWTLKVTGAAVPTADRQPFAVVITGAVSAGTFHDVGVMAILVPADTVDSAAAVTPAAVVRNYGTEPETFPVYFTISMCYSDSAQLTVPAGTIDTVEFPEWTAGVVGDHEMLCWTALAGDENPANNQVTDTVTVLPPTGVSEGQAIPAAFVLGEGRPTPFRREVSIRYGLPRAARVELAVYSTAGMLVRRLASAQLPAGFHDARWDGRDEAGRPVARGVYYCRFETPGERQLRKLVRLD